jgi:hypothetical protein
LDGSLAGSIELPMPARLCPQSGIIEIDVRARRGSKPIWGMSRALLKR